MADDVVDITQVMTRLAALEDAVKALMAQSGSVMDPSAAIAKVHELVQAWNHVPLNGWHSVEDF